MTVDEKFDLLISEIREVKQRMTDVESSVAEVKSSVAEVKSSVAEVESTVSEVKSSVAEVKSSVTGIELSLENETNRNIKLLAENHGSLIDKLNQAIKVSDKTAIYEIQVNILTSKVDRLEKEIAEIKNHIA